MMSRATVLLAVSLVLVAAGLGYVYVTSPTRLTVAVGPSGSSDEKLMATFAEELKRQHTSLRLKILPVADVREAGQALDADRAELAVVRPDVSVPESGMTLAILRDAALVAVAPADDKTSNLTDLAGKSIGIVVEHEADPAFLKLILQHFELDQSIKVESLARGDALAAMQSGRVDAVAMIAPPASPVASDFVRELAHGYAGKIKVLDVDTPEAIAERSPLVTVATIPEGIWGGQPKQPAEETKTVSVSYRLMARADTDRTAVAKLTEALFQQRSRIAAKVPAANFMRAPETETSTSATSATLPNHPGAVDYFQREQQSFSDKYSDWIYLGALFGSGLLSGIAWLRQSISDRRRQLIDDVLDRLLSILSDARAAETRERLDELTSELDRLLAVAVAQARNGLVGSNTTSATVLALDGARAAIDDRRRQIGPSDEEASRMSTSSRLFRIS